MRSFKTTIITSLTVLLTGLTVTIAAAEGDDLAKAVQNPVGSLISVPFSTLTCRAPVGLFNHTIKSHD